MGVSDNLQDEINGQNIDMSFATDEEEKLDVKNSIEMKDITYAYPNTERLIFDHADLKMWIFCWDCWSRVRDISTRTAWM